MTGSKWCIWLCVYVYKMMCYKRNGEGENDDDDDDTSIEDNSGSLKA